MDGLLDGSWRGHQKHQAMMRNLEFSATPPSNSLEWDKALEMELINDHAYVSRPSKKSQKYGVLESFQVGEHIHYQESGMPNWTADRSSQSFPSVLPHLTVHLYPLLYPLIKW